ncbi:MAG: cyclic nucleotide-binding domain-containing protein [Proteobacteria bacterium]|nr:MAG: cyclic nucleotide-binding domain-containing protein [Pseudomonadota bacterium]
MSMTICTWPGSNATTCPRRRGSGTCAPPRATSPPRGRVNCPTNLVTWYLPETSRQISTTMAREEFFNNRLVRGLSQSQSSRLLETGVVVKLPAGHLVMKEGDRIEKLFVILSGEVKVFLPESDKRVAAVKLNLLGVHDCFGEYAMIDGRPASASIETTRESLLYAVSHRRLEREFEAEPEIGRIVYRNLLAILVERLRESNEELDLLTLY